MNDARGNHANATNINELHKLLDRLIGEMAHRGVYGSGELTFSVCDGIIQEKSMEGRTAKQFRPTRKKQQ